MTCADMNKSSAGFERVMDPPGQNWKKSWVEVYHEYARKQSNFAPTFSVIVLTDTFTYRRKAAL
jgi:hypothetical protein